MKCPKCNFDNPSDSKFCKECGTQIISSKEIPVTETLEKPKDELTRGTTLAGRYEIIEELGKGGMGKVYRVEDKKIKEEVALKLIRPEIASDKKTIERFSNELKMARKIAHRNVCKMYDLGEEKGTHYITMEYVPGEDLKSSIRRMGPLTGGKTLFIAKQVCEGLAEAHRLGVVHRDLKPQNIMIDKEGNARIMDFGIARSIKGKGITGAGVMVGTPEYMSPEQAEVKEVDQRSDIYSLGVIFYEMVTGRAPFEGETPLGIAMKHKSEIPKDPREINAQIPEDISRVILRCLEKDKEKRYQSTREIRSELENIEKGIPTTERFFPRKKPRIEKVVKIRGQKIIIYSCVSVFSILLIVAGISFFTRRQKVIDSIAVLPLENLSGDPEQEYFADGMTEALIAELAQIKSFQRVISRTSVMQYKGARKPLPEIARELNVDAVVEGSVLLVGEKVRITAQLLDAKRDRHLWAKSYERDLRDILSLQNEIAQAITQEIKITMTQEEQARLERARPINPKSYQLYLKGRFHWNKRSEEDLKKAIECFEQAIEIDPSNGLANVGLADSFNLLPFYSSYLPKSAYPKAKEAVLKALEIDNKIAEAHASLALIKMVYDWDWSGAEREFKQAIEINPNYATAHHWYAHYFMWLGRFEESITEIERALELDPLSLVINKDTAYILLYAGLYDKAIETSQKAIELDPNFKRIHETLGRVYSQMSKYEEALAEFRKEKELVSGWDPRLETCIAATYLQMGEIDEGKKVLDDMLEKSKETYVPPSFLATLYFALEEKNQGFWWLEKAYEERDVFLLYFKIDSAFDHVRSDPRFAAVLEKIGLE